MSAIAALAQEACMGFAHEPVLTGEVVAMARRTAGRVLVDCTVGGGGHAAALLAALPQARLVGVDRDVEAVRAARARLAEFGERAVIVHGAFSQLRRHLDEVGIATADLILADVGVSSHQLDEPARGFSFRASGPLDMRMDQGSGEPLSERLRAAGVEELAEVVASFGEERHARAVARAVLQAMPRTTGELAEVVRRVVPKSHDGIDPATRTFQGLRIWVNDELGELRRWLDAVPACLAPGGVVGVITFHSLEDRLVKQAFRDLANPCVCPPRLPVCACGRKAVLEVLTKRIVVPSEAEVRRNPRARSAKLRWARRSEGAGA